MSRSDKCDEWDFDPNSPRLVQYKDQFGEYHFRRAEGQQVRSKSSKIIAHYRKSVGALRCGNCAHFDPPTACTEVEGRIVAAGVCNYFKRRIEPNDAVEELPAASASTAQR